MFFVNFKEVWYWDAHLVRTPNEVSFFQIKLGANTFRGLVEFDSFLDRIRYLGKRFFVQRVNKLFLLEFNLIGLVDFAGCKLDGLHDQRHDELL